MPKKAILCVDDEEIVLTALREQLQDFFGEQYRYELAESAEEAMEVMEELAQEGVEVVMIISDWLMPKIKGDEFLINVHQNFPKIMTVILTGHATFEAIERAKKEANLYDYLYKPWTAQELRAVIQSALNDL